MQNAVTKREVQVIWHFTQYENLDSILTNGLLTRTFLEQNDITYKFNDELRLDHCTDSICCSIGFPNYKQFFPFRKSDDDQQWVVLGIQPNILWELDCAFCVENAASKTVTKIPIQQRKGVDAFNKMFLEIEGKPTRKDLGLHLSYPTNPQAEVLVLEKIDPKYIIRVALDSNEEKDNLETKYPNFEFKKNVFFILPQKRSPPLVIVWHLDLFLFRI